MMKDKHNTLRLGVMGCSAFAQRAMIPALGGVENIELAVIASRNAVRADEKAAELGIRASSYDGLVADPKVDVIYMPLPTALHLEWATKALKAGKHLLVEKSLGMDAAETGKMVALAEARGLVVAENFLFPRHAQTSWVREVLESHALGEIRHFRASFTIPALDPGNFRYRGELGGGALLDVGAYMTKSLSVLFGGKPFLQSAVMGHDTRRGIDISGTASYLTACGLPAQVAWAFDTQYQCKWEFLGSKGSLTCLRALTAPPGLNPPVVWECGGERKEEGPPADNHYVNQWRHFVRLVNDPRQAAAERAACLEQAELLDELKKNAHVLKSTR